MEGRAIVREANADYYSKKEDLPSTWELGSAPPMWGKDQSKDSNSSRRPS